MRSNLVSTDPIADMLTRVRNGIAAGKAEVSLPHSKVKETVAKILVDNGFLAKVTTAEQDSRKNLVITISSEDEPAKITEISRLSRPGRRLYVKAPAIPKVKSRRQPKIGR
jgi:small subunit ribosomal protein S8